MNLNQVNELIEKFFEQAGLDPESYVASFKNAVKPLSASEIWAVMDGIIARMDAEILSQKVLVG
jgi:hypothetical protein